MKQMFYIRVQRGGVGQPCEWPDGPGWRLGVRGELHGAVGVYHRDRWWPVVDLATGLTIIDARSRKDARRLADLLLACYVEGRLPDPGSAAEAKLAATCRAYAKKIWIDTLEGAGESGGFAFTPDHGAEVVHLPTARPALRAPDVRPPVTQRQLADWLIVHKYAIWRADDAAQRHVVVPLSGMHGVELAIPWRSVAGLPEVEAVWVCEILPWLARFLGLTEDELITKIQGDQP